MNKTLVVIPGLMVLLGLGAARAGSTGDLAAVVNGVPITEAELDSVTARSLDQPDASLTGAALAQRKLEIRRKMFDALLGRRLLIQEFKSEGLVLPESYVDDRVADIVKQEYGGDAEAFKNTLIEREVTLEHYRDEIRDNAMVGFMRNKKLEEFKSANPNGEVPPSFWTDWLKSLREKASVKILEEDLK